jgi:B12-binding domain/radical SAM domain protein
MSPAFTFVVDRFNRGATAALMAAVETMLDQPASDLRAVTPGQALNLEMDSSSGRTEYVCMSAMTENFGRAARLLAAMRRKSGSGFVSVCGGPHATGNPDSVLAAGFDLCCVGEGEHVVQDLARKTDLLRAAGGGDRSKRTLRGQPLELEDLPPLPATVRFPACVEIGRGCRWGCAYCQTPRIFGHRERFRSPRNVEQAVARYASWGMKDIRLLIPNALGYGAAAPGSPNCDLLEDLLARVKAAAAGGRVYLGSFPSEIRPDYVTPEAMRILRKYVSNRQVVIGAQSGSGRVLEQIGRGHGSECIEDACRIARAEGFRPTIDLMLGLPAEEPADRSATFGLLDRLRPAGVIANMHFFMPLPGTPLAGARPRFLAEAERKHLDGLASKGVVRGRWKRQEELARQA